jgi:oligopeptide transport system ATP-binding protein
MSLLEVKNLTTSFHISVGVVQAVRHVSFHLDMGESLGVWANPARQERDHASR